jgi:acyl-CoA dehydrogenase
VAINVMPIPGLDPAVNDIRRRTADFVNAEILPNEEILYRTSRAGELDGDEQERAHHQSIELREAIKVKVNEAGLWAPHLPAQYGGMGLDFLELAYMYEILSYAVGASALFGVAAPNSGNASVLVKYGTEERSGSSPSSKARWSPVSR